MAGYVGTEQQRRLQARTEAAIGWMRDTPGACNPGRFLGADDPDRLGWDVIFSIFERDGAFGFRMVAADVAEAAAERLAKRGARLDTWDVFIAGAEDVIAATDPILADGPPEGFAIADPADGAEGGGAAALQAFLVEQGIAPFSASILTGAAGPVVNVALVDSDGALSATAHAYLPHNRHSPHHAAAWGGLVAVAPAHRGKRLGVYVNALMARRAVETLGAGRLYELVSTANAPSRRMVAASGLAPDETLRCGIASMGESRFTR